MISLTDTAAENLKTTMEAQNIDSPLRIFLQGSCCGSQLALSIDQGKETDETEEVGGFTFVADKALVLQAGSFSLDFIDDGERKGFLLTSDKPVTMSEGGGCSCDSGCSCG